MASVNKVIIVGNLGRDPEMRTFPNGDKIANVTIATTDTWKDKQSGEMREATEWHRVVFNFRLAEIVEQYRRKDSDVCRACALNRMATAGAFTAVFYGVQVLELVAGAVNIGLLVLNMRDGLRLAGQGRRVRI